MLADTPLCHREIQDFYRESRNYCRLITAKLSNYVCRGTAKFCKIYRDKFLPLSSTQPKLKLLRRQHLRHRMLITHK